VADHEPQIRGAWLWTAASAVGWCAGLAALAAIALRLGQPWGRLCAGLAGGLAFGGLQCLALRPGAGKPAWLLVTAAAWTAALAITQVLPDQDANRFVEVSVRLAGHEAVGLVVLGMVAALPRAAPARFRPQGPHPAGQVVAVKDRRTRTIATRTSEVRRRPSYRPDPPLGGLSYSADQRDAAKRRRGARESLGGLRERQKTQDTTARLRA